MEILININNQKLYVKSGYKDIVSGTQNFIKFRFILDSDWDSLTSFVQFRQDGNSYNQFLNNENCAYLPSEIKAGTCTMALFGSGGNSVRATTNYITFSITENNIVNDASSTNISQSLYEQLVAQVNSTDYESLRAQIELKANKSQVDNLELSFENLANSEVVSSAITSSVKAELETYLNSGVLAGLTITDNTIEKRHLNGSLQGSINKADSSMQPNVYDTGSKKLDVYGYADSKAQEVQDDVDDIKEEITNAYHLTSSNVYTSLGSLIQGVYALSKSYTDDSLSGYQSFSYEIVNSLPATGQPMTFYLKANSSNTGYDKYWWIQDSSGQQKWDKFGSSGTVIVTSLDSIQSPSEDVDYILNSNNSYSYYKYINNGWRLIAGSMSYVLSSLPSVADGNPSADYYILSGTNTYTHYRFVNGNYRVVGSSGDVYTKEEIEQKFSQSNGRISTLENSFSTTSSELSQLSGRVTTIQNTLSNFSEGKEYDATYDEDSGLFTLLEDNETKTSFVIKGGSGGGSGEITSTMSIEKITTDPYIILADGNASIKFNFTNIDGDGDAVGATAYVTIDGTQVINNVELFQGENTIDITPYVSVGTQKVRVYCVDDYESRRYKEWTVRVVEISISSSYDDKYTNEIGRTVSIPYVPIGNIEKTVHFLLNGQQIDTVVTTATGTTLSYALSPRSHGSYLFETYITATVGQTNIETKHVYKDIIWYDDTSNTPIIGCNLRSDYYGNVNMRQYDTVAVTYNVYDPTTYSPKYQIFVDGVKVDQGNLTDTQNVYRYKGNTVGLHTLDIYVGDVVFNADGTVKQSSSRYAHTSVKFNVQQLGIDVSPVSGNLELDFNPVGISNSSDNRLWSNGTYHMTVSDDFDWANGGYRSDENGDTYFLVKAGTTATFDYKMFDTSRTSSGIIYNATAYGTEMKIVFMTENVQDKDAVWLTNVGTISDNANGTTMGIQLGVHEGWLKTNNASDSDIESGEGDDAETIAATNTYLYMPYSEEDIIEMDINIDTIDKSDSSAKSFVMSYEDGVPSKAFVYDNSDDFYQATPKPIVIGSEYCDVRIYRMKIYSTSLSTEGIMRNFIADSRNSTTMLERYDRNSIYYNRDRDEYVPYSSEGTLDPEKLAPIIPNVKVLMLETDHFTTSKKTFVKSSLRCIHAEGGTVYSGDAYYDNWKFENGWHSGQGTTSDNYGNASRNVDFLFNCDGTHKPSDKVNAESDYVSKVTIGYKTENAYTESVTDWKGSTGKVALTRTSVPNNFFNLKVNVASSDNANNALLQKRYNDFLPYVSPAKQRDSKIKNDMEFVPAVLFLRETNPDISTHNEFLDTEWHFYSLGNIGDSKKTDYTRAYDPDDMNEFTIEISDNTKNNATFQTGVYLNASGQRVVEQSGDTSPHTYVYPITNSEWKSGNQRYDMLYNEAFDGDHSFEPRYACCGDYRDGKLVNDTSGRGNEQIAINANVWRAFYRWVVTSTDTEFVNELDQWCVRSAVEFFYAFTHMYTMMDNRAKNTFWHFAKTGVVRDVTKPVAELLHVYYEKSGNDYVPTTDTTINSSKKYYTEYAFDLWDYDNDRVCRCKTLSNIRRKSGD